MFQPALTLDYFTDVEFPQSPDPKYEHMKAHIEHIEFIIRQAKDQISDFKRMTHQLKMEMITIKERFFFETNDIPQDSQTLIANFKKKVKSLNNAFDNETNKAFYELQTVITDKLYLEEQINVAKEKIKKLEDTTGSYGQYYKALTVINKKGK